MCTEILCFSHTNQTSDYKIYLEKRPHIIIKSLFRYPATVECGHEECFVNNVL